ncbi:3-oxoacyl-[acyl-carrier-protein] reductase FabG [Symmachiella macrocystis]|uniref:3-oxoacyl-[acyl-carrier-protein] reductase FabG n=1 Tax=Symmachiella macrocystis TaxID=2527985 RepID=A0A5C6BT40_9PLAN|nr:SDR family oxidoreductase [Symmachiella macrocystis]TWU14952.1 3-oxoacyl-[acyl-carrier-protein] reductase FabG [Symmachiella macrocystis]
MQLNGRNILITGGRRVGAKLAVDLAGRGANIALSYFQSRETIEAVVDDVRELGVRGLAVQADLRKPADVDALVAQTVDELGSIDCLINMASTFNASPLDQLAPEDFDDNIASNLKAPYLTSIAVARAMQQNPTIDGLQGKIVNFADWAVFRPYKDFLPYLIAKGGVVTMTTALALELSPTITVNAVAPAMIDPPPHLTPEQIESIRQASPLKRIGIPSDANNLVMYLLEGTDFVTGEVFRVDGGRFLGTDHL